MRTSRALPCALANCFPLLSVLYVPRGAVHAFANRSGAPSVAYAIYSPPFDGKDRVEADRR